MAPLLLAALPTRVAAGGTTAADLQHACGSPGSRTWLCETVFRITGSNDAAQIADAVARPARILLILLVAFIATRVTRHLVHRFAERVNASTTPGATTAASGRRRAQRAETMATVLRSVISIAIWTIAILTVLGELGVNLAPLLAGAGVAGVVLAFGAQAIVRDFLAGTFMLLEDQYGVGDVIDVGVATGSSSPPVSGTVELVSLRVTRLRDVEGTVWFVPNGEIHRVGNKAQQWARAVLDLAVAPDTDIGAATDVITQVAHDLRADPDWTHRIPSEPEVWGVEALQGDRIVLRLVVRTIPLAQWDVARELRARLKRAFDDAGISLAVAALITGRETRPTSNDEDRTVQPDG